MNEIHSGRTVNKEKKKSPLIPVAAVCTALCAAFCVTFLMPTGEKLPVSSGTCEENGFWEDYSRFAAEIFEAVF